jgi:tetratricopeptide (TPR) repeat protein
MISTRYHGLFLLLFLMVPAHHARAQDDLTQVPTGGPEATVPVAEDDLEADLAAEVPAITEEQMLLDEFERFKELLSSGALDEADASAKQIIELSISTSGPRSGNMAKALTNLAIVQYQAGEYDAAQQNYETAIEIIEDMEDRLNDDLVNPLKGLAAAQLQGGRPDLAARTYQRAVHVTHVNEGPHNLDQIDILENLAEVQLRIGDSETARDIQETIFALNARRYNVNSTEMVPSLMRRAEWQHRAGFIYDERATYRRVIRIIETELGDDSLQLVEPLILLGRSFFSVDTSGATSYQPASLTTGEIYFKRALRISAESPDANWSTIADATLALGDFYMQAGQPQRAKQAYSNAWNLLSERDTTGAKLEKRRKELEDVVLLRQSTLPKYVGDAQPTGVQDVDDPILQGTITLSYSISDRGRVGDVELVEQQPPELVDLQKTVVQVVRRGLFRPRFEGGEAVPTLDQVLVHDFYYRQSDLEAARQMQGGDETDST